MYVFSIDHDSNKVIHANHVPEAVRAKGLDARVWASEVSEILGGKTGGKEDGAQGIGADISKVNEALRIAREYLMKSI